MTSEIDPYVRSLFLQSNGKLNLVEVPSRRDEVSPAISNALGSTLREVGFPELVETASFAEEIFDLLVDGNVFKKETIKFAGDYYTFLPAKYQEYRNKYLSADALYRTGQRVGPRFYPDVFRGFLRAIGDGQPDFPDLGVAPASNRIVLFSDNQISELDQQTSEVIQAVEGQNQIAESTGLRELIIGQLKAGRELIRAGTFRLHFLHITLIQSLRFLAERYEREVIGGLAAALITALAKHIGLDT